MEKGNHYQLPLRSMGVLTNLLIPRMGGFQCLLAFNRKTPAPPRVCKNKGLHSPTIQSSFGYPKWRRMLSNYVLKIPAMNELPILFILYVKASTCWDLVRFIQKKRLMLHPSTMIKYLIPPADLARMLG